MAGNFLSVLAAGTRVRNAIPDIATAVDTRGGWFNIIREPWGEAWQANVSIDAPRDILAFSAVFACITVIASDVAKLRIKLVIEDEDGISEEPKQSPYLAVLRKPNGYQTRIKFIEQWIVSKLLTGNCYALKKRDARGMVRALYMLDPQRVTPLITRGGEVYYKLSADNLSETGEVSVPATEIIHDMMVSLWHPLVGVSPIYACGLSATHGRKIQHNATKFFDNMSRPSGVLSAPATIPDETARRLKTYWEENYTGGNIGRLAVLGDGLKYEAMTIPAVEAQLIEQLRWTVEDVARCFHMPLYKIGGPMPPQTSIEVMQQTYYNDCLQSLIESAEANLDLGLSLPSNYYTEFDLDGLMRMDTAARYEATGKAIKDGWLSPNEARKKENMKPVEGGESPMIQQQNYSLAALKKRDSKADPFATAVPARSATDAAEPAAANDPNAGDAATRALADIYVRGFAEDAAAT